MRAGYGGEQKAMKITKKTGIAFAAAAAAVLMLAVEMTCAAGHASAASVLKAPFNVRAKTLITQAKKAKVTLTWNKVKGASKYGVYQAAKAGGTYRLIKYVKANSYRARYAKTRNVFFKVRAFAGGRKSAASLYAGVRPGKSGFNATKLRLDVISISFKCGKTGTAAGSANGKIAKGLGVRFVSGNPSVVKVVNSRKGGCGLKGLKAGTARVYMIAPSGLSLWKKVTVRPKSGPSPAKEIEIPDCAGMKMEEAKQALLKKGLVCNLYWMKRSDFAVRYPDLDPDDYADKVIAQFTDAGRTVPAVPGKKVKAGSRIYLLSVKEAA